VASVESIVIVGSGGSGAKAAEALREKGFGGVLTMVTADRYPPYARPPLSKAYVRGQLELEKFFLKQPDDVDLRLETRVESVEPGSNEVVLETGERIHYDRLLLATGSEPRRLAIPGAELDGVLYLRTVDDSDAIRAHAREGQKAVVVGAGFIGAEVAASLRTIGLDVVLVEGGRLPLEHAFGPEIGTYYRDLHVRHDVDVHTDAKVEAFEGNGKVERVRVNGEDVDCDFVVVGIGVAPRTELAEQAGLDVDNGVLTNQFLETSALNIFAAGDIANAHHPFYGERVRVEHWFTAANMGPVAAANLLGERESFDRIPYFYSDQYDSSMKYSGRAPEYDEVVVRGDSEKDEFVAFWLADRRIAAVMWVNVDYDRDAADELIRSRKQIDRAKLADPGTPLEEL
jgi:3-phenylpropionate/trans-cinnamate dioxygenase ferredoxin reductase component